MVDLKVYKVHSSSFPGRSTESGTREIVILEFDRGVDPLTAISEAKKQGLVYTTYDDVFCFGVEYPDVQKEHPVVFVHEGFTDSCDFTYRLCLGHIGDKINHISFLYYEHCYRRFAFTREKK